MINLDMLAVA